ncbi:MAG: cupin domain-containing protein [Opitutaceae bacterium]
MNRRLFLTGTPGMLPLAAMAAGESVSATPRVHVARADRSFLHAKLNPSGDGSGPLIVGQSQLRRFGPPRHVHLDQDEWFYPPEGAFVIEVGNDRFELQPGDFLLAPRGVPHVWMHREEEPGRMLIGFEPAGRMVSFFRRFTAGGVLPRPDGMPALMAEHGMRLVGPTLGGHDHGGTPGHRADCPRRAGTVQEGKGARDR